MQQDAATFQVLQEADTQTCAFRSAFNQSWNIGNNEALFVVHSYHTQTWHQSGKRIIRHFRFSRRYRTNKGRFTRVWHPQHTDVSQQHQLQQQLTLITRRTVGFLPWCTVNGRFETGIAQTVPAALSNQQTLTVFSHIAHGFTSTLVDYTRTYRHFNCDVFTALTGTVAACAILTALCTERFFKTIIDKRVQVLVGFHPYVTTITAVAAIRAAFRNILFAAEAHATITAITCNDQNRCFINKLHFILRKSFACAGLRYHRCMLT